MMHSETKEIYGVSVLPVIAIFHQFRRVRAIRKLKACWADDREIRKLAAKCGPLSAWDYFNFQRRYQLIRLLAKPEQQKGII